MRVLIVNTSEKTGGAAVAANRLMDALNNNGVKAKMLVRDKLSDDITVVSVPKSPLLMWHFLWERWSIFCRLHFSRAHLWQIDTASHGVDITNLREYKEADVIHLSWINQGMLSLKTIQKILESDKAVVWTMHDEWMATGICHYAHQCTNYQTECGHCPLLPGGGAKSDLSNKVFRRKRKLLKGGNIFFVACSKWLQNEAKKSGLFVGQRLCAIPNPINTQIFHPKNKQECRMQAGLPTDKRIILFVSQRVTDERKGMSYFIQAVSKMAAAHPEIVDNTVVAVLGGHSEEIEGQLALPVFSLGYVNDEKRIVNTYNAADIFVLPSLEDNLPNTIMEAMACGVPCVGFKTGGVLEMIEHEHTGYLAECANAESLADGMLWTLEHCGESLSANCLKKVAHDYSQRAVAMQYIEIYNQAMASKRYRL